MIIPVRCFTCGKLIADKWAMYEEKVKKLKEEHQEDQGSEDEMCIKDIFNDLDIKRYCCKRMLLSHVDMIQIITNNKSNEYNYDNIK